MRKDPLSIARFLMIADTMATIDGVLYSFTSSGAMQANCQVRLDGDACGYAASSGAITKIGVFSGSNVILQDANDNTLTGWQKFGNTWFYANSDGVMQTGWLKDGSKWYWLDTNSGAIAASITSVRTVFGYRRTSSKTSARRFLTERRRPSIRSTSRSTILRAAARHRTSWIGGRATEISSLPIS